MTQFDEIMTALSDFPVLLSQKHIMAITGRSQPWVSKWMRTPGVPTVTMMETTMIRKDAYARWLAEHETVRQRSRRTTG